MASENKKSELIEACMKIVAEVGLSAFSMKKVTNYVGVSEALIYRHFETKDKLLYICFETVHRQIAGLFQTASVKLPQTEQEIRLSIYNLWMTYFTFLVQNDYRTIFYFEYRDSPYIHAVRESDQEVQTTYFKNFVDIYYAYEQAFQISSKTSEAHLWSYILDTSGIFAKRIIRGELPNTKESYEIIWRLISGGILGLFQE